MNDDTCRSCEVGAYICNRLRSVRAQACCTDCAMDAPGVLHGRPAKDDPKHRGPSWRRGYVDGFNACRAGVPDPTEENP